jgi:hypothetical protein
MNHSIHTFSDEQKVFLRTLQSWYLTQSDDMNSIKVSWLHGMLKKEHYDEHQKAMLNKMVLSYNETFNTKEK